ncbi:MAG: glycosyltransferase family 25 protein [Hyphomicrobiales bacterium]|nr:glycosyltransferase family 25 protein [Hyphomicrobiales bacterium]
MPNAETYPAGNTTPVTSLNQRLELRIISLSRAVERREHMVEEFAKAGLEAKFFDAVDASKADSEFFSETFRRYGRWGMLRMHDMACTLSHLNALKQFLAGNADYCLILEDDVFVSPDLKSWIEDLSWWPTDADVVKIEKWRNNSTRILLGKIKTKHRGRVLRQLQSRHMGCAGYIASRKAATHITSYKHVDLPIDHLIFNVNASPISKKLKIYQVNPALIRQGNEPERASPNSYVKTKEVREKGFQYIKREIRRGFYEINRLHLQIASLVFHHGVLIKPSWK